MSDTFKTTRRSLLVGAAVLVAAPSILRAQSAVRLTLGHGAAPGNPRSVAAEKLAALLKERSNGRIDMRVAGSAQLGDDAAMITALRTGTLDISVNSQGASSAALPELAALGLPFLFANAEKAYKVVDGSIGAELAKRFEAANLVAISWWDNGIRNVTNSKRPIAKPEDLRGLKLRTPPDPMTIDIFQSLGAATQQINFNELYVALQQGVVDGQENPLTNIHSSKLYEVNKFISITGHKWECNPVLVSQVAWARLSEADRKLLVDATKEAAALQRGLSVEADKKLLADFKANPAVTVTEVDQAPFRTATAAVAEKWEARPFGDFVKRLRAAATAA